MARRLADKVKMVVGSSLISNGLSFVTKVLLVRLLSLTTYGLYRQVLLVVEMLTSFFKGGLPRSVYYFFPTLKEGKRQGFVTQTISLLLGSGIITCLGLYFFSNWLAEDYFHQPELSEYLKIIAWWLPSLLVYSMFGPLLISDGKEELVSTVVLAGAIARNAGVLAAFLLTERLDVALWFLVVLGAAEGIFMLYYSWSRKLFGPIKLNWGLLKEQMKFSLPLSLSKQAGIWAKNLDKLLVSFFITTEQFAVYSVGAASLPFINSITYTTNNVLSPRYVTLLHNGNKEGFLCLWHKAIGRICRVIFPIFVFLFVMTGPFVNYLYSSRYASSAGIFRIYLLSLPLAFTNYDVILRAINRTGLILKYTLIHISANLIISVLLFKCLGMIGPALGTVICNYIITGVYILSICRVTGISFQAVLPYRELGRVFLMSIMCGGLLALTNALQIGDFWRLAIGAPWFAICYIVCGHLSGITSLGEVYDLVHVRSYG